MEKYSLSIGIPRAIVSNNDTQFNSQAFKSLCFELGIKNIYSTSRYPQSNGLVEATNKSLLAALKKRLIEAKVK